MGKWHVLLSIFECEKGPQQGIDKFAVITIFHFFVWQLSAVKADVAALVKTNITWNNKSVGYAECYMVRSSVDSWSS